jgi:hypothetical protein
MQDAVRFAHIRRRLRIVRFVGAVDLVLLVALVTASFSGTRELVRILGPLHGGTFLLLLTLTITAAADGYWSWWFPIGIALTGGPIGALGGEWLIGRRLAAQASAADHGGGMAEAETTHRAPVDADPTGVSSMPHAHEPPADAQREGRR